MSNLIKRIRNNRVFAIPTFVKSVIFLFFILLVILTLLIGVVRGITGNPNSNTLNDNSWKEEGPLELSPERGKFALTYTIAEDQTVWFSLPVARFSTPDLGYKDGRYVSLFAPGVSFVILPGYLLGRLFGLSQFGTFLIIGLFAFLNFWLIFAISRMLGSKKYAALVASATFSFGTPALAYGGSLYQHHISVFLILCSLWVLLKFKSNLALIPVWIMIGFSVAVDNPNFFLMFPIGLFALGRIVNFEKIKSKITLDLKPIAAFTILAIFIPLVCFMYFNKLSYGSPFQLSGTVEAVQEIDANGKPAKPSLLTETNLDVVLQNEATNKGAEDPRSAVSFFETRNMLNGFYTHFFSPDRGILFFTPIVLFGFLGMVMVYKKKNPIAVLLISIFAVNIAVYTMWGDPWGGWAFGSRYLIPSYAILAIFLSVVLSAWNRKLIFVLLFYPILIYSLSVNLIGALTTNRNPPKVEVLALEKLSGVEEKYTVERNWDYLKHTSKSFVYQTFAKDKISAVQYFYILLGLSIGIVTLLLVLNYLDRTVKKNP